MIMIGKRSGFTHQIARGLKVRLLGDRVSRRRLGACAADQHSTDLTVAEHLAVTELQADMLLTIHLQLRTTASDVVPLADFEDLFTG